VFALTLNSNTNMTEYLVTDGPFQFCLNLNPRVNSVWVLWCIDLCCVNYQCVL